MQASEGLFSLKGVTLRSRLAILTALIVIASIIVITLAAFASVSQIFHQEIDKNLQSQAQNVIESGVEFPRELSYEGDKYSPKFEQTTNKIRVLVVPAEEAHAHTDREAFKGVIEEPQLSVVTGRQPFNFSTMGNTRVYAVRAPDGRVIIVSQDFAITQEALSSLRLVLVLMVITGALGAIVAGVAVATTGVQPINRLRRAADRVTETGELRQIPVYSNDELGALTRSYNDMMRVLQVSTEKQRDLVADAGHELKTPLTSLRTNIEFLMMASRPNSPAMSEKDRADLERDVMAQLTEMSTLIGDLVDLAREDKNLPVQADVDLQEIFEDCLERVGRRRPDVTFDVHLIPWTVEGDSFSLNRAMRNLLDNAAKWSPEGGTVRVWMEPVAGNGTADNGSADSGTAENSSGGNGSVTQNSAVEIRIADSGPGIPEEDREKVFERFYRSIQSRSMPGSGLGLAIAKQVIIRHNGAIVADQSDDGGALMRVVLPGTSGS